MGDDRIIVVENLVKLFGHIAAVNDVSFEVGKGEVFGILGPNGAGKTTALECIEGLQKPTAGRIEVIGLDVTKDTDAVKQRIGVQLQGSSYFDNLNLSEILQLFGGFYERRVAAGTLLERFALTDKAGSTVGTLSGGQRQRFAIAAALVNDPDLVFLDEPTTGLDPQARHNLWEFVREMRDCGNTVVLTTHYMDEAQTLCDRVAIMDKGKVVALDSPDALISSLPAPYEVKTVIGNEFDIAALRQLDQVVALELRENAELRIRSCDATATLQALLRWSVEAGVLLSGLEVQSANLEDVFLSLTGHGLTDLPEGDEL